MITKILGIILTVCNLIAYSQIIYTKQSLSNNYFSSIRTEVNSNNFIVVNHNYQYSSAVNDYLSRAEILKISPTGSLLSTIPLDSNFVSLSPIRDSNGYYYLIGVLRKFYGANNFATILNLIKFDQNFTMIKKVAFDSVYNTYIGANNIVLKNNSIYLSYTYYSQQNFIKLYKTDLSFTKKDSATFGGPGYTGGCEISKLTNYGTKLLALAGGFPGGSTFGNSSVLTMDTTLSIVSSFVLDSVTSVNPLCYQKIGISGFASLIEINPNKYFVTGSNEVVFNSSCSQNEKTINAFIKNNNTVVSSTIIGAPYVNDRYYYAQTSSSKKYNSIYSTALSGYLYPSSINDPPQANNTKILVHKIDTSGVIKWVKYFGGDMYYNPMSIDATADSGAVISGMRYNISNPAVVGSCEGFILKIDKNGNPLFTGIKTHFGDFVPVKCYPNPAKLSITFEAPIASTFKLSIFDLLGNCVYVNEECQNRTILSLECFTSGLFLYTIRVGDKVFTGKFVKE